AAWPHRRDRVDAERALGPGVTRRRGSARRARRASRLHRFQAHGCGNVLAQRREHLGPAHLPPRLDGEGLEVRAQQVEVPLDRGEVVLQPWYVLEVLGEAPVHGEDPTDEQEQQERGAHHRHQGEVALPRRADEPLLPGHGELARVEQVDAEAAGDHMPLRARPNAWRYCGPLAADSGVGTVDLTFTSRALKG